ncbi:MAG TPA: sulfotransferase [Gammaproteobacteria bacterium]|nr:sulfotransferase [Gammaproteobacteria bacterium]
MNKFDKSGSNLIFIISLPRSGSTMLQRLLGGHPEVLAVPEPWIMLHPLYALKREGINTEYEAFQARQALDDFLEHTANGEETYIEAIRLMASTLYSSALQETGKNFFVDKTPRYFHIMPELHRVFPKAKFVILLRNPIAVLSSVLKTWFNNQPEEFLKSYNQLDMAKGPGLLIEGIRALGDKAIVIRYEELVTDPDTQIRWLSEQLGLTFTPQMLDYSNSKQPRGRFGDQVSINARGTPVENSVEKWRTSLSSKELAGFAQGYLGNLGRELITKLGYDFDELGSSLGNLTAPTK